MFTPKAAKTVINALKQIFRNHGISRKIHFDRYPPLGTYDISSVTS